MPVSTNPEEQSSFSPGPGSDTGGKESFEISAPSISLQKGSGAIRGIVENFAANPVTGTGSRTVRTATRPGRSGFGTQSRYLMTLAQEKTHSVSAGIFHSYQSHTKQIRVCQNIKTRMHPEFSSLSGAGRPGAGSGQRKRDP